MSAWPTGICGCFSDCGTCCCGTFCLPCLYGENTEKLGEGSCFGNCCLYWVLSLLGCQCCLAAGPRGRLRAAHQLGPSPCGDCCTHCWCGPCAVCQEARVLKHYGVVRDHAAGPYRADHAPTQQVAQYPGPQFMAA
ncbi:Cell number regulator 11 [Chlorella vulgaris]